MRLPVQGELIGIHFTSNKNSPKKESGMGSNENRHRILHIKADRCYKGESEVGGTAVDVMKSDSAKEGAMNIFCQRFLLVMSIHCQNKKQCSLLPVERFKSG